MQKLIKIGTRASMLAMWQSNWIKSLINEKYPDVAVELVKIITKGDKILDVPLAKVGGKGLFVKEIEDALLRNEVDIAVHSMKDVPTELPPGLHIGLITKREDPRDAFVSAKWKNLSDLPQGAKVGTSSLRRKSQISGKRPDLIIEDLRGNLDTRVRKLDEGTYDAVILASAGLNRLKMTNRISAFFSPEEMLPAIAQGAVGIEMREADKELHSALSYLHHDETAIAVTAERAFLKRLEGGCQVPIGGFGVVDKGQLTFTGLIATIDGTKILKETLTGPTSEASRLGTETAEKLLAMGGREILEAIYGSNIE